MLFLPTYTATAWYHKKLGSEYQGDLKRTLSEVEKFAEEDYTKALMKGDKLTDAEKSQVADKLARLHRAVSRLRPAGEPASGHHAVHQGTVARSTAGRSAGSTAGLKGIDADAVGDRHEYDPSYATVQGAYTAALNEYVRGDLEV